MAVDTKIKHNIIESFLSSQDNMLKNFADEMPGGFFIYHADKDEKIIYANKAMLRLFNCSSLDEFQELTGNSFRGIVHPDDLEDVEQSIRQQIANSQYDLDYVEYRIIQKGGEIRWLDDYGHFAHTSTAGDIFYVFVSDATEKKKRQQREKEALVTENLKKERQLKDQINEYDQKLKVINQEHLRRLEIIEGLSIDYESIFYADLDTDQIKAYRVSSRFEKEFPQMNRIYNFTGFDNNYIETLVHPDDRKNLYGITSPEYIREKLSGQKDFHINYRILQNGTPVYIQLRIVNVGSDKHISQIVLGYRNIDEEIIQEMKQKQILTEALNEANLANNAKNLFLSNMSHDIRTPMNAITGFTALAKKHIDDKEKAADYLDMISTSSDQLLQLLNDVLEISRIESGSVHVEEKKCSLLDIIHEIQTLMMPQISAKDISFSLDISQLKHDTVYTDRHKLSQILSHLMDNAVKYTHKNGHITIMVTEEKEIKNSRTTYQFTVKDDGIGISRNFFEHLFEPFEREKNTTLSGIYGTGLGLAITKKLVQMIGGTIEAVSTAGKGSRFTVTLPLHISDMQPAYSNSPVDASTQASPSGKKRILIVDDNEINMEIENEVLRDAGFLVDTAADGSIALEKVKHSRPGDYDLILMDIQMPVMNGYRATKAIREIKDPKLAGIPIIAVSANTFDEDKKKAIESGMNAHLAKPLNTAHLFKLIHKFLKNTDHDNLAE